MNLALEIEPGSVISIFDWNWKVSPARDRTQRWVRGEASCRVWRSSAIRLWSFVTSRSMRSARKRRTRAHLLRLGRFETRSILVYLRFVVQLIVDIDPMGLQRRTGRRCPAMLRPEVFLVHATGHGNRAFGRRRRQLRYEGRFRRYFPVRRLGRRSATRVKKKKVELINAQHVRDFYGSAFLCYPIGRCDNSNSFLDVEKSADVYSHIIYVKFLVLMHLLHLKDMCGISQSVERDIPVGEVRVPLGTVVSLGLRGRSTLGGFLRYFRSRYKVWPSVVLPIVIDDGDRSIGTRALVGRERGNKLYFQIR